MYPQDVRDEKVSLARAPWEHGEIVPRMLGPNKLHHLGRLGGDRVQKKFGRESSS